MDCNIKEIIDSARHKYNKNIFQYNLGSILSSSVAKAIIENMCLGAHTTEVKLRLQQYGKWKRISLIDKVLKKLMLNLILFNNFH